MPWTEAVALVSEDRLRAGANLSTVANWKTRGVPWDVIGPILLQRRIAELRSKAEDGADPEWSTAVNYLRAIWRSADPRVRTGIMLNLEAIAKLPTSRIHAPAAGAGQNERKRGQVRAGPKRGSAVG